ncbi:MAG: transketolase [Parcubacteria group bacterium SW_6_46_9]|nr:MAG: transketolase [Parcubacteria group bacterium SW_6_46_9]
MIKENQHLHSDIFADEPSVEYTRNGYGRGLVEVGRENEDVVAVCADLAGSTRTHFFKQEFPDRYIEVGVAEQNLATVGSGLAKYGKIPFISSYAAFNPGRNNEQIRTTIALNDVPVKILGAHAGVSVGPDGATHQQLEDIALMRAQPNMKVIVPADFQEAKKTVHVAYKQDGPVYFRVAREKTPEITTEDSPFEFGVANTLWESDSPDVAIIGCGWLVHKALVAAKQLKKHEDIDTLVINNHTIKPMDEQAVIQAGKRAGAVVTVEEHQVSAGMGSAVAEILAQNVPTPQEFIGVHDQFGESGPPMELVEKYGMGVDAIIEAVKRVKNRK